MSSVRTRYTDSVAFFGQTTPRALVEEFGSPLYVYNEAILRERCRDLLGLSNHPGFRVCFSGKANANLTLLRIIRETGLRADAMSLGELALQLAAGFNPDDLVYVCNNVSVEEMRAAVEKDVLLSLDSLDQVAAFGRNFPGKKIMVRVNPGIGAGHHQKVITGGSKTKFGVRADEFDQLHGLLDKYSLTLAGLNQHIGSLFMVGTAYLEAAEWLLETAGTFPGLEIIDFGGGFGIPYHKYEGESRLDMGDLGKKFHTMLTDWSEKNNYKGKFIIEPGRYTVAECGLTLGTVHATKTNGDIHFVGTDIGFNVLARPMLYDAYHDVEIYRDNAGPEETCLPQTIVGNICESGDILAKDRMLPVIKTGDIIGMLDAGAYGFAMASPYTQRFRPAEVLITAAGPAKLIRRRETIDDIMRMFV
ncbi:diaminopimelate decarboxylase [Deltaproteobacteria bacterium]|nr:diaminopimelate decarboxylase [Deltaproteobacteria bacterium]